MPACFNPARDGMEVATHTPKLIAGRRMQLQLLLRSHPLLCPSCDAGGKCTLQDLVHEYEVPDLPFPRESRYFHVDNDSHFIRFNMNLCIKCGMCVRICDEVQGENELSFVNRGMECEVSTDFGRPLNCEFCGQCAQICPVGAISSKWLIGTGRGFELKMTDTTCSFCSLGCTLTLGEKDKKIVYATSPAAGANEGNLCVKGRYGWPYIFSAERLNKPLIRKEGTLQEVEWNEALTFVAEGFSRIRQASGPQSLAALGSERLTNEEAYVFNRFVRTVLETPHLDHAGGYGYRALTDALAPALGYPAGTNSVREIRKAKVILLLGADLTETHPVAKNEVIVATGRHRAQAIVVDSVRTKLTDRPGIYLPIKPGSEHLIANAMLKWILDSELFDRKAVDLKTDGLDDLVASLQDYSVDKVSEMTGVDAALIREAAEKYAKADTAAIILSQGMNRLGNVVETARAAVNLALVTGHVGKESCGVHVFGEKANAQGAVDMGLAPDLLPGFQSIVDDAARSKFEAAWESPIPKERGFDARQILEKAEAGAIRGLYVVGENPLETYPGRSQVQKALENLEFLVVQDLFLTSTAQQAHAVLPVASFVEKSGTYTSADRMVQRLRAVSGTSGSKSDLEVFTALAALMGKPNLTSAGPEHVMEEIGGLIPAYAGISYERLAREGLHWPCVDPQDPGKKILYEGGFPTGKGKLHAAEAPVVEAASDGYPMYLVPGILKFHSGSFSEWSTAMMEVCPEGLVEMNRKDLRAMGIRDGNMVKITSASGASAQLKVKDSRRAPEGFVIVPQHFSAVKLNNFTQWEQPVVKVQVEKI
jgi:predicted molibdopterin-dependent oxidoreductase YjgC